MIHRRKSRYFLSSGIEIVSLFRATKYHKKMNNQALHFLRSLNFRNQNKDISKENTLFFTARNRDSISIPRGEISPYIAEKLTFYPARNRDTISIPRTLTLMREE